MISMITAMKTLARTSLSIPAATMKTDSTRTLSSSMEKEAELPNQNTRIRT
jgi:hypothetical protein